MEVSIRAPSVPHAVARRYHAEAWHCQASAQQRLATSCDTLQAPTQTTTSKQCDQDHVVRVAQTMAKAGDSLRCYSWAQLWTVLISPWRPSTVSCNQPLAAACQGFTYFCIQDLWVVVFELPPLKTHDMMNFLGPPAGMVWVFV